MKWLYAKHCSSSSFGWGPTMCQGTAPMLVCIISFRPHRNTLRWVFWTSVSLRRKPSLREVKSLAQSPRWLHASLPDFLCTSSMLSVPWEAEQYTLSQDVLLPKLLVGFGQGELHQEIRGKEKKEIPVCFPPTLPPAPHPCCPWAIIDHNKPARTWLW